MLMRILTRVVSLLAFGSLLVAMVLGVRSLFVAWLGPRAESLASWWGWWRRGPGWRSRYGVPGRRESISSRFLQLRPPSWCSGAWTVMATASSRDHLVASAPTTSAPAVGPSTMSVLA